MGNRVGELTLPFLSQESEDPEVMTKFLLGHAAQGGLSTTSFVLPSTG